MKTVDVRLEDNVGGVWFERLWDWAHEYPLMNFDDEGAKSIEEVAESLSDPAVTIWGALCNEVPCGVIGFRRMTQRIGSLNGVCFSKTVHGKGVASLAFALAMDRMWSTGVEKISAAYFADNERIHRFLKTFEFEQEGLLRRHAVRHGVPVDMILVARHA